jgi:hypothetical protein
MSDRANSSPTISAFRRAWQWLSVSASWISQNVAPMENTGRVNDDVLPEPMACAVLYVCRYPDVESGAPVARGSDNGSLYGWTGTAIGCGGLAVDGRKPHRRMGELRTTEVRRLCSDLRRSP